MLEPGERGSGLEFGTACPEDQLEGRWQRLVLTHLAEKEHLGVLTGSPITDMKITLAQGLAVGLEFKLCSEILKTVIVRDWKEIVTVAGIIGLRAALTFLIHWEIKEEKNHS